jgi:hypothetical protein
MTELIFSIIGILIGFFTAGFIKGKKSANDKINEIKLNEMDTIHKDFVDRSNDNRNIRINRLRKYIKD